MPSMSKRKSGITSLNRATPSTPDVLSNFTNYRGNYQSQRTVRPTRWNGSTWSTPNEGGKPSTADVGTCFDSHRMEYPRNDPGATKL